jgi:hypothetical protein
MERATAGGTELSRIAVLEKKKMAQNKLTHLKLFVLVNNRVPRGEQHCAVCGSAIERGYVRDLRTRLIYCDAQCFAGWAHATTSVSKNHGRKVS